ncbi:MAG: Maf family protein [Acutalibacteraceae bacterium]
MDIILASGSPRRRELLHYVYDDFAVLTADVDETAPSGIDAYDLPEYLSKIKCAAVAQNYENSLVIGADTVVICDGTVFGKPKSESDAFNMLKSLSGKAHYVVTGCTIAFGGKYHTFSQKTAVRFYQLSDDEIRRYIKTGEPMDKAGAYGIQGYGSLLIEGIDGDYFNVVGLPVARLKREIERFLAK